jgi:hypothetical protein
MVFVLPKKRWFITESILLFYADLARPDQKPIKKIRDQNADEKKPETPRCFRFLRPGSPGAAYQELNKKFITSPSLTT